MHHPVWTYPPLKDSRLSTVTKRCGLRTPKMDKHNFFREYEKTEAERMQQLVVHKAGKASYAVYFLVVMYVTGFDTYPYIYMLSLSNDLCMDQE
ncbi:hypothetical protein BDN70DRAFT_288977 [Pholiota conissans]|uniref:Transmembrane protein n=1 Tax=Pholiota conissans TaxID=109636 RepID=A0A9P5YSR7_9AGAR|nr:hypothetical protein BDN70DRAFT_288977 [Pholiota conissans]